MRVSKSIPTWVLICSLSFSTFAFAEVEKWLSPQKNLKRPTKSGRKIASNGAPAYSLGGSEVSICNRTFIQVQVDTSDATEAVMSLEVEVPSDYPKGLRRPLLPAFAVSGRAGLTQDLNMQVEGGARYKMQIPFLPFPPPTSNDPDALKRYCFELTRFDHYVETRKSAPIFKTALLQMKPTAQKGFSRVDHIQLNTELRIPILQHIGLTPLPLPMGPTHDLQHVILFSSDVRNQAAQLAAFHNSHGLKSQAFQVDQLPGMSLNDPIPDTCNGPYLRECYFFGDSVDSMDGVGRSTVPSLYGMVGGFPLSQPFKKVADIAGIMRAFLRKLRIDNPGLRYVVLMGDPDQVVSRITTYPENDSWVEPFFGIPSNYYFSEVFTPWIPDTKPATARYSDLVWPNGTYSGTGNSDWDTTHFAWPAGVLKGRAMNAPKNSDIVNHDLTRLLAVGRIVNKPGMPLGVQSYVNRFIGWNQQSTVPRKTYLNVEDGVYYREHIETIDLAIGPVQFFGEGFGTGYLSSSDPLLSHVECNSGRPSSDQWNQIPLGFNGMVTYQSQPNWCKPTDPHLLPSSWPLPAPNEMIAAMNRQRFLVWYIAGHGGPRGIGTNSDGFAGSPGRALDVHNDISQTPQNVGIDQIGFQNGLPSGFIISPACYVGPYLGGSGMSPLVARTYQTFAESSILLANAGVVGSYLNYYDGYYGADPEYDEGISLAIRRVIHEHNGTLPNSSQLSAGAIISHHYALSVGRFGDAILYHEAQYLHAAANAFGNLQPPYQLINRQFFGDPAALIVRSNPGVDLTQ